MADGQGDEAISDNLRCVAHRVRSHKVSLLVDAFARLIAHWVRSYKSAPGRLLGGLAGMPFFPGG
jgi:hypothetical protein